jgi:hypothetical protein
MPFVLDEPCREPLFVHVALPTVAPIEALRIQTVQTVHPRGEPDLRRLDEEVVVRPHQTPGVQSPGEHLRGLREQGEKPLSIEVVDEDEDASDSFRRYVEERILREV